tara:strand:- start:2324 stop:2458 length:135 start_codon:yes stop_codon:yes gene_type:complete
MHYSSYGGGDTKDKKKKKKKGTMGAKNGRVVARNMKKTGRSKKG